MKKYKSILLVDDDFETTLLGKRFLTDLKIADEIYAASNGKEAMNYFNQRRAESKNDVEISPEVILLDIQMPVMDGFEFLQAFNETHKPIRDKIKIFMLSASQNEEDIQRAKSFNVNGFIVKPLTKQKIIESLLEGLFRNY